MAEYLTAHLTGMGMGMGWNVRKSFLAGPTLLPTGPVREPASESISRRSTGTIPLSWHSHDCGFARLT